MKLSEKGFKALLHKVRSGFFWGYEDDIHKAKDHDFKPDDFKGVVCLTVEEAKGLALKLMSNDEFFFLQTGEFDYDTDAWCQYLIDKIEQAESKDESN